MVAGASGGIGRQIAQQLAECGARLTLTARDQSALEALGIDATLVSADLRDGRAGKAIVSAALSANNGLDGLVNAAGASRIIAAIWAAEREVPADAFGT